MKTNFNLRNQKGTGETLIFLVIRWDNRKLTYSTRETIDPKFWETDKEKRNFQRAKETKQFPEYPEFNARLSWIESTVKNAFRKFLNDNDNRPPQVEELKTLLDLCLRKFQNNQKKDLFGFIEKLIADAKNSFNTKTGKQLARGTIVIYQNVLNILKEYANKKRKRIDFDVIDLNFYHEYTEYLSKEMQYANNTIGRHVKTLKSWLNDAAERGLHKNFAFKSKKFKVITELTDSIYLNDKELAELFKLNLSGNTKLERVRDLFLVGCFTGLRFSDFSSIEERNIKGDFIEILTKKTAEVVLIPIHRTVRLVMEKYKDRYPNSLPPSISNVKTNNYLKEIGKMLECLHVSVETKVTKGGVVRTSINKKYELLVTHTARRSFATNLYKSGFPSIAIMKITGHRTEKAFLRYIKITPNENASMLKQHTQHLFKEENKSSLANKFAKYKLEKPELKQRTDLCILVRENMLWDIEKRMNYSESSVIYSKWEGYKTDKKVETFLNFFKKNNCEIESIHTSGHADTNTIKDFIKYSTPKKIIPVHTETPKKYVDLFGDIVVEIKDGIEYTV